MSLLEPQHDEDIQPGSNRSFGITFACVFAIVCAILVFYQASGVWIGVFAALAVVSLGLAFFLPSALSGLNRLWFRFGMLLAKITQPIVLGLVFFLVITPIGIMRRLFGADPMRRKVPKTGTLWIERAPLSEGAEHDTPNMTRQF